MPGHSGTIWWQGRKHEEAWKTDWKTDGRRGKNNGLVLTIGSSIFYMIFTCFHDPVQVRVHFDVMLKDTSSFNYAF